jgi:hypothetical protein
VFRAKDETPKNKGFFDEKIKKWYYLAVMDAQSLRKMCTVINLMNKALGVLGKKRNAEKENVLRVFGEKCQNGIIWQ